MGQFAQYNRAIKHRRSDYDGKKQTGGRDPQAERGAAQWDRNGISRPEY